MISATNETGTVSFTYDNRNRQTSTTDVFGHLVEYGYDAASNRTQLKLDSNVHTNYIYDDANRLTTLTDEASQNFTFGYDFADRLISKTLPNGVTTTYNYDGMSRLKSLKHQSSTATLFDNQYGYNTANQISQIAELTQTKNFTYDNVNRLTGMTSGAASESYAFDDVGNRNSSHRSSTYNYQPFNKLTATATANYNYDANGNMVSKAEGTNFWRYGFDYENRLVSASMRRQTVRYRYDALGRRVQRYLVGNKENTKFIYDGLDVVADDNFGVLTKYQNGLGIDNKLKVSSGGVSNYFLQDHLGSTVGLTNSSSAITEQTAYDSFGNTTNNLSTRYQFTGREHDLFTGLQYSRARFYDANLGRFISEDPIGFAGGDINLFGYVRNNPLLFRDPSGNIPSLGEAWSWITSWFYTPSEDSTAISCKAEILTEVENVDNAQFNKLIDFRFTGNDVGNNYVMVQWVRGYMKKNGKFVTTTSQGKPNTDVNFPNWTIDDPDTDAIYPPFSTSPNQLDYRDIPQPNYINSGDYLESNLEFKSNLYRKDQVQGLNSLIDPNNPAPAASVDWSFVRTHRVP